ncbi:MAG: hypothetical protein ABR889_10325 [Acidobacteriaceae bacterium]
MSETANTMRGVVSIATTLTAVVVLLAIIRIWILHDVGYYYTGDSVSAETVKFLHETLATDMLLLFISALTFIASFFERRKMFVMNLILSALCLVGILCLFHADYIALSRIHS